MNLHPQVDIEPGVRCLPVPSPTLPPATHTNAWVVGQKRIVVVDPAATDPTHIESLLGQLKAWGTVEAVILTHHHHDHIGSAAAVARAFDAPILAHPETAQRVPLDCERLHHGDLIRTDGPTLTAHHTPGHAPGHLALEIDTGSWIVGDLVAGTGTILIDPGDDGHLGTYLQSLRAVRAAGPTKLLPAHGPVSNDPQATLDHYLQHRDARTQQILDAVRGGATTPIDVARIVYAHLPPNWQLLATRQIEAHLIYAEEGGHITRSADVWSVPDA